MSPARDRETIERFLNAYVERAASEDRENEELMMLALDSSGQPTGGDNWDWESSKTLTHIIERGLQFPRRAFSVSLKTRDASLAGAILGFDADNQVICGVSIDDEGAKTENLEHAKTLLHEMANALGATHGFIGLEEPPPLRGTRPATAIRIYAWTSA
jgi:hypothetical protein